MAFECSSHLWPEATGEIGQYVCMVITGITMLISIPGNVLTALIIIKSETLHSEPAYLLICSVCLADTLVSTVAQPLYIVTLSYGTRSSCIIDHTYFAFAWISSVASTLGIITITFDRYLYIVHPLRYKILMNKARAKCMIILVWLIAVLYGIIPNFYHQPLVLHSTTLTILIATAFFMGYTYGKVYSKVTNAANPPLPTNSSKYQKMRMKSQNQATRTVLLVVVAFFGCWFPWVVVSFIISLFHHIDSLQGFSSDSIIMKLHWIFLGAGYSNSALNVFIYSRKNTVLRSTIQKFVEITFGIEHNGDNGQKCVCCLILLLREKLKTRKRQSRMKTPKNQPAVISHADAENNNQVIEIHHDDHVIGINEDILVLEKQVARDNTAFYDELPVINDILNADVLRRKSWCGKEIFERSLKRTRAETQLSILSI